MRKVIALLIIILLMLGFLGGYLYLSKKIDIGSLKIAAGQEQIKQGEQLLAQGKVRMEKGKQKLSNAKNTYKQMKMGSWLMTAVMPLVGVAVMTSNEIAGQKIAEGNQRIAKGKEKILTGEKQLASGIKDLSLGNQKLLFANRIRIGCAIAAIFFAFLLLALVFFWRRSLLKMIRRD